MALKVITGNIFTSHCQTLVNTVNCVGVMGAGLALECRLRYPLMHERYVHLCNDGKIAIGLLWIYKAPDRWILNFPTKQHWRYPSKIEYLHNGLQKFIRTFKDRGIESVAFPMLGADKGGLAEDESLRVMASYLKDAELEVEIYRYDRNAKDDLYETTKQWLLGQDVDQIASATKLRKDYVAKVMDAMEMMPVSQLNQLAQVDGIGIKTLEKIFWLARAVLVDSVELPAEQKRLL